MKALALLLLATPLAAQASPLSLQGYADSVVEITRLGTRQERNLNYLSLGSDAREMVQRLAALSPPTALAESHATLVDRAQRWAWSATKAARPVRTGVSACFGASAATDAECRSGTFPAFNDRQDAATRFSRFQFVRRQLLRQLEEAGARVPHAA